MGFFKRKKKNSSIPASAGDELVAVLSAAISASDDGEAVAVMAAALAAYGDDAAGSLRVSKIDRSARVIPAWGVMGNREQIDTRRF
jgi:ribosomal protein L39E